MSRAKEVLDCFLFEDIVNYTVHNEDEWAVTYEGNNFVVLERATGKLSHFRVKIKSHDWDSRQAIEDQEWFD